MSKKKIPELKIEEVCSPVNCALLSLIEHKRDIYLCVIDNVSSDEIGAYVLDYAEQQDIPVSTFISLVTRWFYKASDSHPLSIELSKHGLTDRLSVIYRAFNINHVSRVIGQAFTYEDVLKSKVKRRRVNVIQEGIPITIKKTLGIDS